MYCINIWNMLITVSAKIFFKRGETSIICSDSSGLTENVWLNIDYHKSSSLARWDLRKPVLFKFSRVFGTASKDPSRGKAAPTSYGFSACNLYSTRCSTRRLLASTATQKNTDARRHERLNGFVSSNVYFMFLSAVRSDMFQEATVTSVVCMSRKS